VVRLAATYRKTSVNRRNTEAFTASQIGALGGGLEDNRLSASVIETAVLSLALVN
jgi:hypothetical protein